MTTGAAEASVLVPGGGKVFSAVALMAKCDTFAPGEGPPSA
jgi:hypothetical protein